MFIEGQNAKKIHMTFPQYSLAQIEHVTDLQPETDPQIGSILPNKSKKGRGSVIEVTINNKEILKNIDGTYISENDVDEINRRCSFIEGFRKITFHSEGYDVIMWGKGSKNEKIHVIKLKSFYILTKIDKDRPKLPSLESIREYWDACYGIHHSYIVNVKNISGRSVVELSIPVYHVKQFCEQLGILEKPSRGKEFILNMEECPVCLQTRHCVDVGCPEGARHSICANCIRDWSKESTVFSCPMCRSEHGKDKIKKILIKDQHRGKKI